MVHLFHSQIIRNQFLSMYKVLHCILLRQQFGAGRNNRRRLEDVLGSIAKESHVFTRLRIGVISLSYTKQYVCHYMYELRNAYMCVREAYRHTRRRQKRRKTFCDDTANAQKVAPRAACTFQILPQAGGLASLDNGRFFFVGGKASLSTSARRTISRVTRAHNPYDGPKTFVSCSIVRFVFPCARSRLCHFSPYNWITAATTNSLHEPVTCKFWKLAANAGSFETSENSHTLGRAKTDLLKGCICHAKRKRLAPCARWWRACQRPWENQIGFRNNSHLHDFLGQNFAFGAILL